MTNPAHMLETALLLLVAYLLGCVLGYATRRLLFAARGTRQVGPAAVAAPIPAPTAQPRRVLTSAARLAAAGSDDPSPPVVVSAVVAPVTASKPAPVSRPQPIDPKPPSLTGPRGGKPDNLRQIKGIGPKIEASLHSLGIYHLDQIAAWTAANIAWVDLHLAFRGRIRREHWVEQAAELTRRRA